MRRTVHFFAASTAAFVIAAAPGSTRAAASLRIERQVTDEATVAGTEPADDPEALSAAAVAAFRAKEYDNAISLFERAYAADPQPNYLFNIGRVHEEKGELAKAVEYYQRFVQSAGVDLEARENAVARLKVLRATLAELEEKKAPEDEPARKATTETQPRETSPLDDRRRVRDRKFRLAGYSLLGVGGVGMVIGAAFGGIALAKSRKASSTERVDEKLALRQEAKGPAAAGDGLLIAGGVLAATGLVLVLVTLRKSKSARADTVARRTFAPMLGGDRVGLAWTGRF